MTGLLFVPQSQLDAWLEAGSVDVTAEGLHLQEAATVAPPLPLEPSFRFLSLLEGEDAVGLLGKVKSEAQLRDMGAEACGDSVLLGDVVYEVAPGFLVEVAAPGGPGIGTSRSAVSPGAGVPPRGKSS
jgi:hypothetical protein